MDGAEFATREARIDPPAEHPIPIWLGSYGPRALALTGRRADGWLPSLGRLTLAEASARREVVRAAAAEAGRDPDDVTCACNIAIRVRPGAEPSPGVLTGTVDEVVAQTLEVVAAGFTVLLVHSLTEADQELLAAEVLPAVRAAAVERGFARLP
ncbi:hypothetical protein GCM10009836_45510 [Pseudonocardia ailaonensis]|uniref:Luciferase-like domain-containing protein n=1 Tax=Pseudonocardia ailaonensis TaxID=367279 RepID=A0ABN2NBH2_9PSEU